MLNKKFVFAVSLVAMMAVSNAWATDPASTPSTLDTVGTAHSVFTAYTPTEAGSKAGIAGVTYVNRAVNSAGNAAIAAENHAAASGAYAIDAKSAAEQANTAAAAAKAAADAAQATASEGVTKANAAQQTANENTVAISGMDLTSVGADGRYIKTVAQADGKVTATAEVADTTPTQNSKKMVTSGGVYTALSNKLDKTGTAPKATADASGNVITSTYATKSELTSGLATKQNNLGYTAENSANKVTALSANSTDTQYPSAKLVYTELAKKQNNLTIDTAMSSTSTNPVQNKVVNTALGTKENVSNKVTTDTYSSGDTNKYPSIKTAEAIANTAVAATKSGLESLTARVAANEGVIDTLGTLAYKDTVTSALITDGAVTSAKIADSNVTTAKIADGAVTAGKTSGVIGKIPSGGATASTYADIWVEQFRFGVERVGKG